MRGSSRDAGRRAFQPELTVREPYSQRGGRLGETSRLPHLRLRLDGIRPLALGVARGRRESTVWILVPG